VTTPLRRRRRRGARPSIVTLRRPARSQAVPTLRDSFVGYYRWHAKRTLREVDQVRAIREGKRVVALVMFEELVRGVGYVNYLAVARDHRREGMGKRLLDEALAVLRRRGSFIVFSAAARSNRASIALLESRGFRRTRRSERSWVDGGLGAWGLRSRMHIVAGEVVLARRWRARARAPSSYL